MSARRTPAAIAAVLATTVTVSGCSFASLNDLPLPGTQGRGAGAYTVRIELADVTGVVPNSRVRVADVDVGTVTDLAVEDRHAVLTVGIDEGVQLPADAVARVGQTTLLGSKHVELGPPAGSAGTGRLRDGDTIPLTRSATFPETEEVLATVALVLNGSGLEQIRTITTELNLALTTHRGDVRELLGRLAEVLAGLEAQKQDIVDAIDGLERLAGRLAEQKQVIADGLDGIEPALATLVAEREDLTTALRNLGELGEVGTRVVESTREDLLANLRNLPPVLAALADSGSSLTDALMIAGTVPFPLRTYANAVRGDYANIRVTADLTLQTLDRGFLSGTPLEGRAEALEAALGDLPPVAGQALDPLRPAPQPDPLAPEAESPTTAPAQPGLLDTLLPGGPS